MNEVLFILKKNQIYYGDCMRLMKQIPDRSIQLTIADIPYGSASKTGAERAKYKGQLRKLDKGKADIVTFDIIDFLDEVTRITKGSIYIFCGIEQISEIYSYLKENKKKNFMARLCVWKKTNPSPANGQHMWLSGSEYIVFAKRRKTEFNQKCQSNVFEFPTERGRKHPTQKPLGLLKYLIESSSSEGDLVFDPVCGSGSALVAAKQLNRNYLGVELDKCYYQTALDFVNSVKDN